MFGRHRDRERGQLIVLFTLALVAMVAMVGLIIDGGNAYANQRATQNATDASSERGATVLMQSIMSVAGGGPPKTDGNVLAAMDLAASDNNIKPFGQDDADHSVAYYTDVRGNMLTADGTTTTSTELAARVGAGLIPECDTAADCVNGVASGIRALGRRDFNAVISGVVGLTKFSAQSDATAVSGYVGPCDEDEGCALLPVTFATNLTTCDTSGDADYEVEAWEPATPPYTGANEALLSLCKKGEGGFGWLDFGTGNTANQILNPPNQQFYPRLWQLGKAGNPNDVEDELNTYAGNIVGTYEPGPPATPGNDQTVLIPLFNGLCNEDRPDEWVYDGTTSTWVVNPLYEPPGSPPVFPMECSDNPAGGGANRYYHVPSFIGFILDHAYVQGNDFPECNQAPGSPLPGGNGSGGCLKGWIVRIASEGPVGAAPPGGNPDSPLGVQLVK